MAIIKFKDKKIDVELRDEVDRSVANEIFKFREYRSAESAIESAKLPILDVGAHIGLFSLYVRALNPTVPIIALEPEVNNFKRLEKTIAENQIENIQLECLALSSKSGQGNLIVSNDSQNHRLSFASENVSGQKVEKVKTTSLADYCKKNQIKKIALIKLDIEGGEFELIESWAKDDFNLFESILLEYHNVFGNEHKRLVEILRINGFGVQVFPSQFDRMMGFVFAKRKK
ncbi:MAG: Methyltransferase, FkbM family [Parcubacteria group bacterium GW2011_GWC2_39_14]|nr:MAG: Methyltransferase, FkbM family [Parcubacteria group bacterium GW2011_GWC2_39_14]KKR54847.1 MAG: Methyltransferase, FkbM family [Parcubacteria group bacterium GW2011_GWA2_40_23]